MSAAFDLFGPFRTNLKNKQNELRTQCNPIALHTVVTTANVIFCHISCSSAMRCSIFPSPKSSHKQFNRLNVTPFTLAVMSGVRATPNCEGYTLLLSFCTRPDTALLRRCVRYAISLTLSSSSSSFRKSKQIVNS